VGDYQLIKELMNGVEGQPCMTIMVPRGSSSKKMD
jgi:hypothetical protein